MRAGMIESLSVMALACLGVAEAWRLSGAIRAEAPFHDVIGPDRYLAGVSLGLFVCGALSFAGSLKGLRPAEAKKEGESGRTALVLWVILASAVYSFLIPVLGYLPATCLFFPVVYYLFGVRPWLKSVVIGLSTSALFYAIFEYFAEIPLPKGLLETVL